MPIIAAGDRMRQVRATATNFEVAFAAARRLHSSYCCLAHGTVLLVLAAAARCFFAKTLDALGVRADASYQALEPELREALVVGRPIAD